MLPARAVTRDAPDRPPRPSWTSRPCLFLRLPKLGRKVMIGMLAGSEVINFEKACTNKECKKALLEAYEGTEVFGFEFLPLRAVRASW